ncbi:proline dehydrogenase family protein [Paenibacillus hexagrammi]|uniref:Proline dehydrogenase family protein n=1 Tax=Paenibacillus hexagrammi TaxID=2908839 RepID=A0ABY3SPJ0_9BACL|nr:proline dehydrogenase family protein [Paenibacillus sp. YPD9-1]UJF35868.1 proline dehydrogenase family protein [Paenibacillus sp. YPD9-1]
MTLDLLGESVSDREMAEKAASGILMTLEAIAGHKLNSHVSVKLSQLGVCFDPAFCLEQMRRICACAAQLGIFIRIDMEDSSLTQTTLELYRQLAAEFGHETIGIVIQAYLYRSEEDIAELVKMGANVRIVKGAYHEPPELAFPRKKDVDYNYLHLAQSLLASGCYTAIATHDEQMIALLNMFAEAEDIDREQFEFQMLYGIRPALQRQLASEGYKVRVYTPFGDQWYPYFTRRIAERPANLWFVAKGLFAK